MITLKHPRQRIFVAFLTYTLISFGVATLCFWLFRRVESINVLADKVHEVHIDIRNLSKLRSDFLLYEPLNLDFYQTGNSTYLKNYIITEQEILIKIDSLSGSSQAKKWKMQDDLDSLYSEIKLSTSQMKELSRQMRLRGYKNYGKEGILRKLAHQIEEIPQLNQESILQLRRYEKDFINRLDSSALEKWHIYFATVQKDIHSKFRRKPDKRVMVDSLLESYQYIFEQLVDLEYYIGYRTKTSLTLDTDIQNTQILSRIDKLDSYAQQKKERILKQLRFITVVVVTVSVIMSMLLSLSFPYIMKI